MPQLASAKSKANKHILLEFYFRKPSPSASISAAEQLSTSTVVVSMQWLSPPSLVVISKDTDKSKIRNK
jgi:hypothetical protein